MARMIDWRLGGAMWSAWSSGMPPFPIGATTHSDATGLHTYAYADRMLGTQDKREYAHQCK